jgi:protein phosphatase
MPHSDSRWTAAGVSLQGSRRANEDRFLVLEGLGPGGGLFLVVDGMGGHLGGARAAELTVRAVSEHLREHRPNGDPAGTLEHAFRRAEELLAAEARPEFSGMGAVALAALYRPPWLHLAYLGDARAYRARGNTCAVVTQDQTIGFKLLEEGRLTPEEFRKSPWRHHLIQFLGRRHAAIAHVTLDIQPEDRLLLATDGAWEWLEDAGIQELLRKAADPPELVAAVQSRAGKAVPRDNATVLAVYWG